MYQMSVTRQRQDYKIADYQTSIDASTNLNHSFTTSQIGHVSTMVGALQNEIENVNGRLK